MYEQVLIRCFLWYFLQYPIGKSWNQSQHLANDLRYAYEDSRLNHNYENA
jgi:hypothetical protein